MMVQGRILWPSKPDGRPRLKRFLSEIRSQFTGFSSIQEPGFTTDGTRDLEDLFGEKILGFPKPTKLIALLLAQWTNATDHNIVLDFFAGSGTTAQSVLEQNKADGGNRKFILVQLPEPTDRKDFPTIADITKERVRRVIQKLEESREKAQEAQKKEEQESLFASSASYRGQQDLGFKVFRLQGSNFKAWNSDAPKDAEQLGKQLEMHVQHIEAGRTQEDILFEILLKSGFPLSTRIEPLTLAGKTVFSIAEGAMLLCLEKELTEAVIKEMAARKPERVVCLDAGFAGNDQLKTNAAQAFKAKGVTSFRTV